MSVAEDAEKLLVPVLRQNDYELADIQYRRESGGWILRVFIDKLPVDGKERIVSLEDCEKVSRIAGMVLDGSELFMDRYNLEVSSPGINRALKNEAQFQRFIGKKAKISLFAPLTLETKQKNFSGTLLRCGNETVEIEDIVSGKVQIAYSQISKAHLDII